MGVRNEKSYHCRVGVNHSLNVTLDPFLEELRKDYFTISVFTASRSCSLETPGHSHFHYESSLLSSIDYSNLLNSSQLIDSNTAESMNVSWIEDTGVFMNSSRIVATLFPSPIIRLTFTLMGSIQSQFAFLYLILR